MNIRISENIRTGYFGYSDIHPESSRHPIGSGYSGYLDGWMAWITSPTLTRELGAGKKNGAFRTEKPTNGRTGLDPYQTLWDGGCGA